MRKQLDDLRDVPVERLRPLLDEERGEWWQHLKWERDRFTRLCLRLARRRRLSGWLLSEGGQPLAKVLLGDHGATRSLDMPYSAVARRGEGLLPRLLEHPIRELQATPEVARIETALFPFGETDPTPFLAAKGFRTLPRLYMARRHSGTSRPAPAPPEVPGIRLTRWRRFDPQLPRLLRDAYLDTPDREASEVYSTAAGCLVYLDALVRGEECGSFSAALSATARDSSGRAIGFLLGTLISADTAHLAQVAVHPEWQGRGVGRLLLDHFFARGGRIGLKSSTLLVTRSNHRARHWYGRAGYEELEPFVSFWWGRSDSPST
jgi:ribosomal protein S18 acetylase RimI-like enzyme